MADNSATFKSVSSLGIFRPWQFGCVVKAEEKNDLSSTHQQYSIFNLTKPLPSLPSTSSPASLMFGSVRGSEDGTLLPRDKFSPVDPEEITGIKKERLEVISDAVVSSSTEKRAKSALPKVRLRGVKRKVDASEETLAQRKQAKSDVLLIQQTAAFSHPPPSFPSTPEASRSTFLQELPSSRITLPHSSSQFLQPNSQLGSPFVPLFEPPLFVPAAEMERVCARRPRPKRFSCGECGAAFSNRGQLSGHCRIHTGERPFRCSQPGCGKRFTRNEELTRHRRIHSGLRPFACGVCPKRFGRKDHLKKHLRTHTRHVLPQFPSIAHLEHLQHLQHVQQLQHLQQLQQIQRLHLHMPLIPIPHDGKTL